MRESGHKEKDVREINYRTALRLIDENVQTMGVDRVDLEKAINRVLSSDVFVEEDYPPHNISLYDGYAVKSDSMDLIKGEKYATWKFTLVNTGDKVHEADFVIPKEYAEVNDQRRLEVNRDHIEEIKRLKTILRKGEELKKGDKILRMGRPLRETDIMVLKNAGVETVEVYKTPVVAVIPTGVELKREIPESNSLFITTYLKRLGFDVRKFDVVPDSLSLLSTAFEKAKSCSAVITTGGTAKGERDVVRRFMEGNCRVLFQRTNLKPGKSALFGLYDGKPVFCLPGTPSACFSAFFSYALYGLKKMVSMDVKSHKAILKHPISTQGNARFFIARFYDGYIETLKNSFLRDLPSANAYLIVDEDTSLKRGGLIEFQLI
jgi:molybdenum cofactor synthesis domain-containing protein